MRICCWNGSPVNKSFCIALAPLVLVFFLASSATAQTGKPKIAILDFLNNSGGAVKAQEVEYLAEVVRGAARSALPARQFILMTRNNILELLPPGRTLGDCAGDCAVETGRKLGARYVVTGEVTMFAHELRSVLQLYDTEEGNLLIQERVGGEGLSALEAQLESAAHKLLLPLRSGHVSDVGSLGRAGPLGGGGQAWAPGGTAEVVVSFSSDPVGAWVEIDGQPVAETPCKRPLVPGVYQIGIKKVRYVAHTAVLKVEPGMQGVSVTLTPDFGWLTVSSDPAGLKVRIDGKQAGQTPLAKLELDTGVHDVLVVSPFYYDEGRRVVMGRGEHKRLAVSPVPRNGGLKVLAVDADGNAAAGKVIIDEVDFGETYAPLTVLIGPHRLQVTSQSGEWSGTVTITERELQEVQVTLASSDLATGLADLKLVSIPAGSFTMGSPSGEDGRFDDEVQHLVTLTHGFLMSRTEVTQAQYEAVMGDNPSDHEGADLPVEQVSWFDAVKFCNALSKREGLSLAYRINGNGVTWDHSANGYRLPTEAEWEYACRAGTATRFHTGDRERDLGKAGWYDGNASGETHPVGEKSANSWGLYDLHGNVWEWCWDLYGDYKIGRATNPAGPVQGSYRVLRGGSCYYSARGCRSAFRDGSAPGSRYWNDGFRVVRSSFE